MKKSIVYTFVMLVLGITMMACSNDDKPFETISEDDYPCILDPIFPDRSGDNLATFSTISRTDSLSISLTVTPSKYSKVTWWIDGEEVPSGTDTDTDLKIVLKAGTYDLKIIVKTDADKETSREGLVQVNPLETDPWASTIAYERIVAPGTQGKLFGNNMDQVVKVLVGGQEATDISYVHMNDESYLQYTVPEELAAGDYRVILVDADGVEYGGGIVKVTQSTLVVSGASRATANAKCTLQGINLDQVMTLQIGDQTVSKFISQSSEQLVFTVPDLSDGDYTMTGTTSDGSTVEFYIDDAITNTATLAITTTRILWEGHHYVSWDLPDGNPNKVFNLISSDVFSGLSAGAVLKIDYSVEPSAEYHKLQVSTSWWTNLADAIEFNTDGTYELTLTQEILDKIQQEEGFQCVGHGYFVDLVTVK